MAAIFANSTRVALRSGASSSFKAGAAGLSFARGKATLPDLSCTLNTVQNPQADTFIIEESTREASGTNVNLRRLWRS